MGNVIKKKSIQKSNAVHAERDQTLSAQVTYFASDDEKPRDENKKADAYMMHTPRSPTTPSFDAFADSFPAQMVATNIERGPRTFSASPLHASECRRLSDFETLFAQPAPDLRFLFENNRAWAEKNTRNDPNYFKDMSSGQSPKFLIIGCADSRVPVQEIFGLKAGECFVHRNVANLVVNGDMNLLAVLQYAVEHLHVQDIIVCGHYGCGGVKAASTEVDHGLLEHWLRNIRDVIFTHMDEISLFTDKEAQLRHIVELNVREQCFNLYRNPIVQKMQRSTGMYPRIHGMAYDLNDGLVKQLNIRFKEEMVKNYNAYGVHNSAN